MKKFGLLFVVFEIVLTLSVKNVFAQEVDLERIVVTPYRFEEQIQKIPASINVISGEDIQNSNAKTVLDALRSVSGLIVRDWYGSATKASVDIRGFGEQGGMNVLVLVDGRRVNEVDLSAVDWTQISLDQVKRIEIIRGGNSVLYGDNAVSGVINIITKRGKGKPKFELGVQTGSYDMNSQRFSVSGSNNSISYWFTGSREGTHGYRNNSFYNSRDFASKIEYDINNDLVLHFDSGYHRLSYGLPGALSSNDLENYDRTYSKYGDDRASQKDYYFVLGGKKEFRDLGKFNVDISFRKKTVSTNYIGANAGWNPLLESYIETTGITPKYELEKFIFGFKNKIIAGLDFYRYDYSYDTYNSSNILQDFSDINKITLGGYMQNEFSIFQNFILVGGYRYESAKYEFDYHDNSGAFSDVDKNIRPNKKAFNSGLSYNYKDDSNLFFNINQSFRFPATDEYFTWGSLNTELKPQTSRNYEAGIRHRFSDRLKCDITFFRMNIQNELYYNPIGGPFGFGANENYDKTRHEGFELKLDSKIIKNIELFSNYSYTKSAFKDGVYDDKNIPMVPRHKGNIGMRFFLPKDITLNVWADYVGDRYFINDQANSFSRLNGYVTVSLNVSYTYKDFTFSGGINNIFDKEYSEYGVCNNITGAKNYYPNPARNFNLKLEYKF